jgi:hypothetical protein
MKAIILKPIVWLVALLAQAVAGLYLPPLLEDSKILGGEWRSIVQTKTLRSLSGALLSNPVEKAAEYRPAIRSSSAGGQKAAMSQYGYGLDSFVASQR